MPWTATTPAGDEADALTREALATSGDIIPVTANCSSGSTRSPRPRRTRALAALCDQLTASGARYPGTSLILRYEVKPPNPA